MLRARAGLLAALGWAASLGACTREAPRAPAPPAPVQAVAPRPPPGPALLTAPAVDVELRALWAQAGVTPTAPATDAAWLRRMWLDVLGTIPPVDLTRRFRADASPDKRARAIDDALASPSWADHWTAYWDDVWMGAGTRAPDVDRGAFRAWLHDAFARGASWSAMVAELLTASGVNSDGGQKQDAFAAEGDAPAAGVHGAVNWTLRYRETPEDMAGSASRTLLGVQIQCAQCHDHKTERWTQADFRSFAASFVRTRFAPLEPPAMGQVRRIEVSDAERPAPRFARAKGGDLGPLLTAPPRAIDGTPLDGPGGVRVALARWVTAPDNPWFSHAFVNRMWGHFLGRGFVDPVDDLRPSNPASASPLFDALARDFAASGFDVKHLVRLIVGSEAYALSAAPMSDATAKADPEARLWERFRVTPLGPDDLLNAIEAATGLDDVVRHAGRLNLAKVRARVKQRYAFLFDVDEESDAPAYSGTIAQALALLNGSLVSAGASTLPGSALAAVLAAPGDDASKIEELYLRTLSRPPTPAESARWFAYLEEAPAFAAPAAEPGGAKIRTPDPLAGLPVRAAKATADARAGAYEDLLWTLLNTSEFALNH